MFVRTPVDTLRYILMHVGWRAARFCAIKMNLAGIIIGVGVAAVVVCVAVATMHVALLTPALFCAVGVHLFQKEDVY